MNQQRKEKERRTKYIQLSELVNHMQILNLKFKTKLNTTTYTRGVCMYICMYVIACETVVSLISLNWIICIQ